MATLDDIKAVLEGIRSDLSGAGAAAPAANMSERDMRDYVDAVKAHTEALEKQIEATEKAAAAQKDLEEGGGVVGEMFSKLSGDMGKAGNSIGKYAKGAGALSKMFDGLVDIGKEVAKMSFDHMLAMDKATNSFRAQTGAAQQLGAAMNSVIDSTIKFGVTARDVEKAATALYGTFSDFAFMSRDVATGLLKDVAILEQVGLSFQSSADLIQMSNKLLGHSLKQTSDMLYLVRRAAMDIGMPIDEFARKIVPLTEKLAGMGDKAMDAAASVLRLHRETGMAVDSIMGLDDQMYTFEGATRFAQRMNQALGGNFFDPHTLMEAFDEGPLEVAKLVKSQFEKSGVDTANMGRRALRFIARNAQMQDADLRKLMENQITEEPISMFAGGGDAQRAAAARQQAEQDALINMKSASEYANNMKKAFLTMPMAPVVAEMKSLLQASNGAVQSTLDIANNMKAAFVETHKTKLAMLALGKIVYDQNESLIGGLGAVIAGSLAVALGAAKKFGPKMTKHLSPKGFARGSGILIALYGMVDGIQKVNEAGGDFEDLWGGISLGIMGAFGETLEFLTGGFIDKTLDALGIDYKGSFSLLNLFSEKTFSESWAEIDWSFIGETFDFMEMEYKMSWSDIFNLDEWETIWIDTKEALEGYWDNFNDWWGRSSPSKRMQDAGSDIVAGLVGPFDNINAILEPITQSMIDIVPEPIQDLISGDTNFGAIAAAAATANQNAVAGIAEALSGKDNSQTIEVSFQLDGREVDRKILNVVGGVVQPLVT